MYLPLRFSLHWHLCSSSVLQWIGEWHRGMSSNLLSLLIVFSWVQYFPLSAASSICSFPKSGWQKNFSALRYCILALAEVKSVTNKLHSLPVRMVLFINWRLGDDLRSHQTSYSTGRCFETCTGFHLSVCNVIAKIQPLSWQLLRCHPVNSALQEMLSHSTFTLVICEYPQLPEHSSERKCWTLPALLAQFQRV